MVKANHRQVRDRGMQNHVEIDCGVMWYNAVWCGLVWCDGVGWDGVQLSGVGWAQYHNVERYIESPRCPPFRPQQRSSMRGRILLRPSKKIRQTLAESGSDHQQCALDIDPLHLFEHCFGTCAMEANWSNIPGNFVFLAMDTNSNSILNSSCCFARRPLCKPPDMFIWTRFI